MLIIGAKGFAKELLEILHQNGETNQLCFYDDVSTNVPNLLYGQFPVIKSIEEAEKYFSTEDKRFTIGIGNPSLRKKMHEKFSAIGGDYVSTISKNAETGSFGIQIAEGCNILGGVRISNDVTIGRGTMVYYNSIITHDVGIGEFCEISPGATLLGRCKLGNAVQIGAGAIIFPDVEIGDNSIVAAGAVVRNNLPINVIAAGVPAEIKKHI